MSLVAGLALLTGAFVVTGAAPALASTAPGAPTMLNASSLAPFSNDVLDGGAVVYWWAPASDGGSPITGYVVTASPGGQTATDFLTFESDGHTYYYAELSGLTNGSDYTFSVVATNLTGNSPPSSPSLLTTIGSVWRIASPSQDATYTLNQQVAFSFGANDASMILDNHLKVDGVEVLYKEFDPFDNSCSVCDEADLAAGLVFLPTSSPGTHVVTWHTQDTQERSIDFSRTYQVVDPTNAAPDNPASLGQFEANGTTPIGLGATTDGTAVVLKGAVSDPDGGQLQLEVEVKAVGTAFDGSSTVTSASVTSGSTAQVTVGGLFRTRSYHWRARTVDPFGAVSNWVAFGANSESSADLRVEAPIVFSSNRQGANNANQQEIYSMNPDGTNPIRLTTNTTVDTDPSLSPDGTKIAFQSNRDGDYEIFVMNLDGTQVVQLTTNTSADQAPAWSPDGTKIAIVSNRISNGNYDVWTMNANGTNPVRLTTVAATDNYPSWSSDGTKIAFMSLRDGDSEIFTMNANGSNQVQLTSNKRDDTFPAWSPDGTKIVFSSNRDTQNNPDIYAMNANGSSVVRLRRSRARTRRRHGRATVPGSCSKGSIQITTGRSTGSLRTGAG